MSIFDLSRLNEQQRAIIQSALDRTDFPWERLRDGLKAQTGRTSIPVDFSDLSRWQDAVENADGGHAHVHDEDHDTGHILGAEVDGRKAALGLAWYSGRVSIEQKLVNDPDLAVEVFLAEGAHMVDFFYMTDAMREFVFDAYHGVGADHTHGPGDTSHGWFEETGNQDYWSWVGESFMSGFTRAYGKGIVERLESRQPWRHRSTPHAVAAIFATLTPERVQTGLVGVPGKAIYHLASCRTLKRTPRERPLLREELAIRRPCRVCKPDKAGTPAPAAGTLGTPASPNLWHRSLRMSLPWKRRRA